MESQLPAQALLLIGTGASVALNGIGHTMDLSHKGSQILVGHFNLRLAPYVAPLYQ